jgi:hypothetical protein
MDCHNLAIVDLSYNQLEDPHIVQVRRSRAASELWLEEFLDVIAHKTITSLPGCLQIFGSMNNLRVLTLTGNPVLRKISYYRNVLIVQCVST